MCQIETKKATGGKGIKIDTCQKQGNAFRAMMYKNIVVAIVFGVFLCGCTPNHMEEVKHEILFLGDASFGENYQEKLSTNILEKNGYEYSLENFEKKLTTADLVIANLETPLTNKRESELTKEKSYVHYSDPQKATDAFSAHNMTAFSLANNHTLDRGEEGLYDTIKALKEKGMYSFGAGMDEEESNKYFIHKFDTDFTLAVISAFEYRNIYDKKYQFYADGKNQG
jgi:hypothetical protein